jgi:probable DNA repair protein
MRPALHDSSELLHDIDDGAVVLCATQRLARYIGVLHTRHAIADGRTVWSAPAILPLRAWLASRHAELLLLSPDTRCKPVLGAAQENALWEEALRARREGGDAVNTDALARMMSEAFAGEALWQLRADDPLTEDHALYLRVREDLLGRCEQLGLSPSARMWIAVTDALRDGLLPAPRLVLLAGFDLDMPAAQAALLDALDARGSELRMYTPEKDAVRCHRESYSSREEEIRAAANWARTALEQGEKDIGIVFPRLDEDRARIQRLFQEVLAPRTLPEVDDRDSTPLFEISLGGSLAREALASAALHALDMLRARVRLESVSRVLRSPFLAGGREHEHVRARLDVQLREYATDELATRDCIDFLQSHAEAGDSLPTRLSELLRPPDVALPSVWADTFDHALTALGWPGERALGSREHQVRQRFSEQLRVFASLDRCVGALGCGEALTRFRRLVVDTIFQMESREAPIQIMGVLESAGRRFRLLRICDMCSESWPPAPRPLPFIPITAQRAAGVIGAVPDRHAEVMQRLTADLPRRGDIVVLSSATMEGDNELQWTPMMRAYEESVAPAVPPSLATILRVRSTTPLERFTDARAPTLPMQHAPRGGSRVLALQAACPFRAFAEARLAPASPALPERGVRPLDRGNLLHLTLQHATELLTRRTWENDEMERAMDEALRAGLRAASGDRFRDMPAHLLEAERECLRLLLREWLRLEHERPPFTIQSVELPAEVAIGGLNLRVRIDRVDRLDDGSSLLIDYKSGKKSLADWMGERPAEPQLPLYAAAMREQVRGVAFAIVRRASCAYAGLTDGDQGIAGVMDAAEWTAKIDMLSWDELRAQWLRVLETLATAFREGDARVDPRDGARTCQYCSLPALCRVGDSRNTDEEEDAQGGEDDG